MRLERNLSAISQPAAWVEAMVVSEMKERLSPKKAPPTTRAVMNSSPVPVFAAMPEAMGTSATMVPTLVPTAMDMKHAVMNRPTSIRLSGTAPRSRDTVASTAPICLALPAKAPASMNIHIISSTLGCPAPRDMVPIRDARLPRDTATAYTQATRKAAGTGIR